jgi:beta-1,4-N-acetylglucosaminyltransferase
MNDFLVFSVAITLAGLLATRVLFVLLQIRHARKHGRCLAVNTQRSVRVLAVLGSGGHTTELLTLVQALDAARFQFVFCKAASDTTSAQRLEQYFSTQGNNQQFTVLNIPRARDVGQSYWTSIWTTLRAQWFAFRVLQKARAQLVLCNGPGTCVPVCVAAIVARILFGVSIQIIFCESLCRVQTLSLTGKLLYPIADLFLVHWSELNEAYPLTERVQKFMKDE